MDLDEMKCVECEGGIPPLSREKIEELMPQLHTEWRLSDDAKKISRAFTFKNFKSAIAFADGVGRIAESEGHHPELTVGWGKVVVALWTHAIGGLHENDFIVARRVDLLAEHGASHTISIDEFSRVQLRVGTVREARAVPNSEKLVALSIDLGSETRQIVAGIRSAYTPESLVGTQLVLVANLEPKTLLGLESQGMVLAANGETPVILCPEKPVPPGTGIR